MNKFKDCLQDIKEEIQMRKVSLDQRSRSKKSNFISYKDPTAVLQTQPEETIEDLGTFGSIERSGSARGKSIQMFRNKRNSTPLTGFNSRYKRTKSFLKPARLAGMFA